MIEISWELFFNAVAKIKVYSYLAYVNLFEKSDLK